MAKKSGKKRNSANIEKEDPDESEDEDEEDDGEVEVFSPQQIKKVKVHRTGTRTSPRFTKKTQRNDAPLPSQSESEEAEDDDDDDEPTPAPSTHVLAAKRVLEDVDYDNDDDDDNEEVPNSNKAFPTVVAKARKAAAKKQRKGTGTTTLKKVPPPTDGKRSRGKNWTKLEDVIMTHAYINASGNSKKGTNQKGLSLWTEVWRNMIALWHKRKSYAIDEDRSRSKNHEGWSQDGRQPNNIKARWRKILPQVRVFHSIYGMKEQSGSNEEFQYAAAEKEYFEKNPDADKDKDKKDKDGLLRFPYRRVWETLLDSKSYQILTTKKRRSNNNPNHAGYDAIVSGNSDNEMDDDGDSGDDENEDGANSNNGQDCDAIDSAMVAADDMDDTTVDASASRRLFGDGSEAINPSTKSTTKPAAFDTSTTTENLATKPAAIYPSSTSANLAKKPAAIDPVKTSANSAKKPAAKPAAKPSSTKKSRAQVPVNLSSGINIGVARPIGSKKAKLADKLKTSGATANQTEVATAQAIQQLGQGMAAMTNLLASSQQQQNSSGAALSEDPRADIALLNHLPENLRAMFAQQIFSTRSMMLSMKKQQLLQMGISDPLAVVPAEQFHQTNATTVTVPTQQFAFQTAVTAPTEQSLVPTAMSPAEQLPYQPTAASAQETIQQVPPMASLVTQLSETPTQQADEVEIDEEDQIKDIEQL